MKQVKIYFALIALVLGFSVSAQEYKLTPSQTPQQIKDYVTRFFPDGNISRVTKEKNLFKIEYDVELDNNVDLEFNKKFEARKIEAQKPLPEAVIPVNVYKYVQDTYPDSHILSWKGNSITQKVELDNGLELQFDFNGGFIRASQD